MTGAQWAVIVSAGLFIGLLVCLEFGYRIGRRSCEKNPGLAHEGIGVIEAAVFALLGLLLGFSFSGATSRLETRRELVVKEANAISTAYLRLDEVPAPDQPELRRLFRIYLDSRLRAYQKLPDLKAVDAELVQTDRIQQEIWSRAVAASRTDSTQNCARLLLPALNDMIDVTVSRTIALHTHLPALILVLLITVALVSALLAGYAMAKRQTRSWGHMLVYSLVIAATVFSVIDLDYPRSGFIRLDAADKALIKLQESIR